MARTMIAAALVAGMSIASTPTALAKIVERDRWSFADSYNDELCGMNVRIDEEASGSFMLRADRPGSTAFLASNVFEFREVITNEDTGDWLVVRGKRNYREVTATHVEGDVYRFRAQTAGQPFVVEDQSGKVVLRDRGLLVFEILFDTLGDDEPGGEELSFEVVAIRGPHPAFLEDLCPLAHELIG